MHTWSDLHCCVGRVADAVQIGMLWQQDAAVAVNLGRLPREPAVPGQQKRAGPPNYAEACHDAIYSGYPHPPSSQNRDRHSIACRRTLGLDVYLGAGLRA